MAAWAGWAGPAPLKQMHDGFFRSRTKPGKKCPIPLSYEQKKVDTTCVAASCTVSLWSLVPLSTPQSTRVTPHTYPPLMPTDTTGSQPFCPQGNVSAHAIVDHDDLPDPEESEHTSCHTPAVPHSREPSRRLKTGRQDRERGKRVSSK